MNTPIRHTQTTPVTPWTIYHSLQHFPQVTVVVGDEEVMADIIYPGDPRSPSPVVISFQEPQAGVAELV